MHYWPPFWCGCEMYSARAMRWSELNKYTLMLPGSDLYSLKCNSKSSTNFFFLHNFPDRRFVLTIDLSNLSMWFFSFPYFCSFLSKGLSPFFFFHFKGAFYSFSLVYLKGQHHCSCVLGPLLSKILKHKICSKVTVMW